MSIELKKDIYWVGAVDWNMRSFHGHTYTTKRGTTYNAYLIRDEKTVLIDTVLGSFSQELLAGIREIVPPEKIDYIVSNHVETDHSGALPQLLKLCPKARVFTSAKGKDGLYKHYYGNWDFQVVKTGDTLKLGTRTLAFIEAPMLHWPDSMFTYCPEEKILFPNDAFGQHLATSARFDDEVDPCVLMDEAAKYYGNILWPFSALVLKKIDEIQRLKLAPEMIAPSHGIIWRRDPAKIINAYLQWARNETVPKVVCVYETMWGSTQALARAIVKALVAAGIEVKLFDIAQSDTSEIIKEMLDARGYLFGSSTHDNDMLPTLAGFLEFFKGLKPKNRLAAVFGSYGWAGGATKEIEGVLQQAGVALAQPSFSVQYVPSEKELSAAVAWAQAFAKIIKSQ